MNQSEARELVRLIVEDATSREAGPVRLGAIPDNYSSGRPSVIFDGETNPSAKEFPYLDSYTPVGGDRVMLVRAGSSWVVIGKIV